MDRAIQYRVAAIISEMGRSRPVSLVDDFDPRYCIKNFGPYRLYEFHLEIQESVDFMDFLADFCEFMDQYNALSKIKADFYEANKYPGPAKNWATVYLTVATI